MKSFKYVVENVRTLLSMLATCQAFPGRIARIVEETFHHVSFGKSREMIHLPVEELINAG
jgi:hypothetical protein